MSFLDRFRREPAQVPGVLPSRPVHHAADPRRDRHALHAPAPPALSVRPHNSADPWLRPGTGINLAGYNIVGGLLYVGTQLTAPSGYSADPALINPALPVDLRRPDWGGQGLDYWPSYSDIPPHSRAAYLSWLADGRRFPQAPIGYVFLYFYGLERRVLHDLQRDRSSAAFELPIIHQEVRRLLRIYGGQKAFNRYAGQFEQVLDLLATGAPERDPAPPPTRDYPPPLRLRAGLGALAAQGVPVPAEWALTWIRSHPEYYPRTPATRCAAEFDALFLRRYAARYGKGLLVRPGRKEVTLDYRPASAGFRGVAALTLPGIPDVLGYAAPTRKLVALADECTSDLEAYSRYLGRVPDGQRSVQAQALLPAELMNLSGGVAGQAIAWAHQRLDTREFAVVPVSEFSTFISSPQAAKLVKKDVVALAQVLGRAGVGVEPDPRLGGAVLTSGSMVLFTAPDGPTAAASDAYQAATLLLHLAAAVSAADGDFDETEQRHLSNHLERALHLTAEERRRLHAHLRWLTVTPVKLTGLTRRIAGIDAGQRQYVAEFLTAVAGADGRISPDEVKTLTKIYRLLELDPALLAVSTRPMPATEPVVVRPAQPERGYAIPQRTEQTVAPLVRLDEAAIAAKLAETARVGALLGSIFTEDETPPAAAPLPAAAPVAGLDGQHSGLVRELASGEQVSRARFEHLAARWKLLPDGALDRINEAAYELAGEPLLDGDDPIRVDRNLLGEMLT
ncbi:TerB N-terminal domain-containing protein [Nonomuraea sp. NPDC050478]|uniref:TerB N-terminal domain-containing protein n=1 Tax=Nonomuraea sp. NPDC050478 TaxID=3364365 RepID=UPI0037AAA575